MLNKENKKGVIIIEVEKIYDLCVADREPNDK